VIISRKGKQIMVFFSGKVMRSGVWSRYFIFTAGYQKKLVAAQS
jgi:hypothetical protein